MARQLNNKVIVITGGANGIGFGIADKYLTEGAKTVIILDIEEDVGNASVEKLNKIHGKDKAIFLICDVTTDLEAVGDNILATFKTIDVLVNCAGTGDESNPRKTIAINTTAVVEWTLKFYENMRTDKGGSGGTIISISSIYGYRISPVIPIYNTTKFAVVAFTRSLGHKDNFDKTGVRVVAICSGFTETRLTKALLDKENKQGIAEEIMELGRMFPWQTVDDVGNAAVEVFKRADSGTAWLIEGGQPIVEVPFNDAQ